MPARPHAATRIIVMSDSFLAREGLACLLASVVGIDVVGRVRNPIEVLQVIERTEVDVIVAGIRARRAATGEILGAIRLRTRYAEVGMVVIIVALEGDGFATELLRRGTMGMTFLLDERIDDLDALVAAIAQARSGQVTVDETLVEAGLRPRLPSILDELTHRELDVLAQMARGHNNRSIAQALSVSAKAVERHVTNIFRKLGLSESERLDRRVSAVLAYLEEVGLLSAAARNRLT